MKAVDLFAGAGGFSLGLTRAGFDVVLANELSTEPEWSYRVNLLHGTPESDFPERPALAVRAARSRYRAIARGQIIKERESLLDDYERHMRGGDIEQVLPNHWLREWKSRVGEVDVVVGGPPCQGFSSAGARDPADIRNSLPAQAIRVIRQLQPKVALIENVPGMLQRFSDQIYEVGMALSAPAAGLPGYHIVAELLHGELLGVPQTRRRLLLVAIREDMISTQAHRQLCRVVFPTACPAYRFDSSLPASFVDTKERLTANAVMGDLAREPNSYGARGSSWFHDYAELEIKGGFQREMRLAREAYLAGDLKGSTSTTRYANHEASVHCSRVVERMGLLREAALSSPEGRENRCSSGWLRKQFIPLHPHLKTNKASQRVLLADEWPSLTVTSLPDDIVHFRENRIPTVREVARLQTFPDWFEFKGVRTTGADRRRAGVYVPQYTQVANAVPPRLAYAVASQIRWFLEHVEGRGLRDCEFSLCGGDYSSPNHGSEGEVLARLNNAFRDASDRLVREGGKPT